MPGGTGLRGVVVCASVFVCSVPTFADEIDKLIKKMREKESYTVRAEASKALAQKGAPAVPRLVKALGHKDLYIGDGAVKALVEIGEPAVRPLIAALNHKRDRTRANAAFALAQIEAAEAFDPLVAALEDPSPRVRARAANGLSGAGGTRAVEPLCRALQDPEEPVVLAALTDLGRLLAGNRSSPPSELELQIRDAMLPLLTDDREGVRLVAADKLHGVPDPAVTAALLDRLKAEDWVVAVAAFPLFISQGVPGTEELLCRALVHRGNKRMAEAMVNSGNDKLVAAGELWARQHGYQVTTSPFRSTGSGWGSAADP